MVKWTARQGEAPKEKKWLDGHIYRLTPGVDYKHLGTIRARLWKVADLYQGHVRTKLEDGYLYVQGLDADYQERPGAELRDADGTPVPSPGQ